jgi:hypothetical protein
MLDAEYVDAIQTVGLILNTLVLAYIVFRLERAFTNASEKLRSVLTHQKETLDSINKVWTRINEIEARVGMKPNLNFIETPELRATLAVLAKRLDDLERGRDE